MTGTNEKAELTARKAKAAIDWWKSKFSASGFQITESGNKMVLVGVHTEIATTAADKPVALVKIETLIMTDAELARWRTKAHDLAGVEEISIDEAMQRTMPTTNAAV